MNINQFNLKCLTESCKSKWELSLHVTKTYCLLGSEIIYFLKYIKKLTHQFFDLNFPSELHRYILNIIIQLLQEEKKKYDLRPIREKIKYYGDTYKISYYDIYHCSFCHEELWERKRYFTCTECRIDCCGKCFSSKTFIETKNNHYTCLYCYNIECINCNQKIGRNGYIRCLKCNQFCCNTFKCRISFRELICKKCGIGNYSSKELINFNIAMKYNKFK